MRDIKQILEEIKEVLKKIYMDRLKGLILYGSFARGDDVEGSDIDLILLLDDMKDPLSERRRYFDMIWKISLKYDMVISIIPFKEEDYKNKNIPLILNVKREGIII